MTTRHADEFVTPTQQQWVERLSGHIAPDFETLLNRKQARYPVEFGAATLTFAEGSKPVTLSGRVLDVSATGLMMKTHRQVGIHTPVWLDLHINDEQMSVGGRVVHATATVGGYKLGILLTFADDG